MVRGWNCSSFCACLLIILVLSYVWLWLKSEKRTVLRRRAGFLSAGRLDGFKRTCGTTCSHRGLTGRPYFELRNDEGIAGPAIKTASTIWKILIYRAKSSQCGPTCGASTTNRRTSKTKALQQTSDSQFPSKAKQRISSRHAA